MTSKEVPVSSEINHKLGRREERSQAVLHNPPSELRMSVSPSPDQAVLHNPPSELRVSVSPSPVSSTVFSYIGYC
jgi:hypothetical protein